MLCNRLERDTMSKTLNWFVFKLFNTMLQQRVLRNYSSFSSVWAMMAFLSIMYYQHRLIQFVHRPTSNLNMDNKPLSRWYWIWKRTLRNAVWWNYQTYTEHWIFMKLFAAKEQRRWSSQYLIIFMIKTSRIYARDGGKVLAVVVIVSRSHLVSDLSETKTNIFRHRAGRTG